MKDERKMRARRTQKKPWMTIVAQKVWLRRRVLAAARVLVAFWRGQRDGAWLAARRTCAMARSGTL